MLPTKAALGGRSIHADELEAAMTTVIASLAALAGIAVTVRAQRQAQRRPALRPVPISGQRARSRSGPRG
jgi:hypothetical protein